MSQIWKFVLRRPDLAGGALLVVPAKTKIVAWGVQEPDIVAWGQVDMRVVGAEPDVYRYLVVNTGVEYAGDLADHHVATVTVSDVVWHIFRREFE